MHEWIAVLLAGLFGGVVDSILSGGFTIPRIRPGEEGQRIVDPGFIGKIIVGGVAGLGAWSLTKNPSFADTMVNAKPVIGALLAGASGGEVVTSIANRQYLSAAKKQLAEVGQSNANTANAINVILEHAHEREQQLQAEIDELKKR